MATEWAGQGLALFLMFGLEGNKGMRKKASKLILAAMAATLIGLLPPSADAAPKKDFKVAWSIYVGWMPWGWANDNGVVKKWADKYGINISVVQFNDYVEFDQPVHCRSLRCGDCDQHGRALGPGRRRRRHHRGHRRRLLQRQ